MSSLSNHNSSKLSFISTESLDENDIRMLFKFQLTQPMRHVQVLRQVIKRDFCGR